MKIFLMKIGNPPFPCDIGLLDVHRYLPTVPRSICLFDLICNIFLASRFWSECLWPVRLPVNKIVPFPAKSLWGPSWPVVFRVSGKWPSHSLFQGIGPVDFSFEATAFEAIVCPPRLSSHRLWPVTAPLSSPNWGIGPSDAHSEAANKVISEEWHLVHLSWNTFRAASCHHHCPFGYAACHSFTHIFPFLNLHKVHPARDAFLHKYICSCFTHIEFFLRANWTLPAQAFWKGLMCELVTYLFEREHKLGRLDES